MANNELSESLQDLKATVREIEKRVSRLEQGLPGLTSVQTQTEVRSFNALEGSGGAEGIEGVSYSSFFTGFALVCFSLLGALVLRLATQQGLFNPTAGTILGLTFGLSLIIGPRLLRRNCAVKRYAGVFQHCGVVLIPLIILETYHRNTVLGPTSAVVAISVAWLVASTGAMTEERRSLAVVACLGAIATVVGLGFSADGAILRASFVVALSALTFGIAFRKGWGFLRPVVLLPSLVVLGAAVLMTARRTSFPPATSSALLICATALTALLLLNHMLRYRDLGQGEAAWLPAAAVWACGLGFYAAGDLALEVCALCGTVLLTIAVLLSRRTRDSTERARCLTSGDTSPQSAVTPVPGLLGLVSAGSLLVLLTFPWYDRSGITLMLAAHAVWFSAHLAQSRFLKSGAYVLLVAATAVAVFTGGRADLEGGGVVNTMAGRMVLGVLALGFWWNEDRSRSAVAKAGMGWPLLIPLGCTVTAWFGAYHRIVYYFGAGGESSRLADSSYIAALSMVALFWGKSSQKREILALGLGCVGVLALKVVFRDLFSLTGLQLLGAVIALGLACLTASFVLRTVKA